MVDPDKSTCSEEDRDRRASLEAAARAGGATLNVPSGGIGALDVLKTACIAGVDSVTICVMKPPQAWKGIDAVEAVIEGGGKGLQLWHRIWGDESCIRVTQGELAGAKHHVLHGTQHMAGEPRQR